MLKRNPSKETSAADVGHVLLDFVQVSHKVCMGRSRIYGLIKEGSFPAPIKIGDSSRWLSSEIDAYIEQLLSTRTTKESNDNSK